ncbi:MAG: polysaccharide biosynthesis/export family protein [Planctomycetota bacterium]|nr:polysaccharide biosynthesis/export family protein [Planctomycetota bacterium]
MSGRQQDPRRGVSRGIRATGLVGTVWILAGAVLLSTGCAQNEIGRYNWWPTVVNNPLRVRNPIVKSENYWVQRDVEPEEEFPGPMPEDLKQPQADYILGAEDLVDVTVFELLAPGQPYTTRQRISQTGKITLPYLGTIQCSGLTARGLEEKLADMLDPDFLVDPQVTVFVQEYRNLEISLLNGVPRPGRYPLVGQDMTLLELLAQAGGVLELVENYGFVIRQYTPEEADILMLQAGTPPEEEAAEVGAPPRRAVPAAEKAGAPAAPPAPATPKAAPAAPEAAPAAPEAAPAAPEAAPAAPKAAPAAPEAAPAAPEAAPAAPEAAPAAPKAAPKTGAEPAAEAAPAAPEVGEARAVLQKMAEGEMPEVKRIEEAEAKNAAPAPPAPAVEKAAPEPAAVPRGDEALAADEKKLGHWVWSDGKWVEIKTEQAAPVVPEAPAGVEPTAVAKAKAEEKAPAAERAAPSALAAERLEAKLRRLGVVQGSGQLKRIIRFDVQALQGGDPTQNLVLRDGDIITIPSPPIGDFYMTGYVSRPGVYSLTGRKITLLQAIAAAGGLTAIAVPWRTEVVRRVTEEEEEIIYVDLSKVARGEVPDFYVKPEDIIRVGTDWGAIHNAVIRNAFRATYGAGAVYDMNFADFYPWAGDISPIF